MAARYCVECGNLVTTAFCPSCGAIQPPQVGDIAQSASGTSPDYADSEQTEWRPADVDESTGQLFDPLLTDPADQTTSTSWPAPGGSPSWPTQDASNDPSWPTPGTPARGVPFWSSQPEQDEQSARAGQSEPAAGAGEAGSEQPWHPFEQPSWYPGYADPRATDDPRTRAWGNPPPSTPPRPQPPVTDSGPDFMGVSSWQAEETAPVADTQRRNWILGGLAALAVVAVLVAVVAIVLRSQQADNATPSAPSTTSQSTSSIEGSPTTPTSNSGLPPVTVTITSSESSGTTSEVSSQASPPADPMGGPIKDIACSPGFIVQIASGLDEASFKARVAELNAAGQLPADLSVANTATSCPIFTSQVNTLVLYAGPFASPYDGCDARLGGAPDSFIKGTTAETAKQYVSCLCPVQAVTLPLISTLGQTGVWIGELQRVLANKLKYSIPDLTGPNWGTYTQTTINAVKQFQADKGLPATGQVDAGTWQALQIAQC